MRNSSRDDRDTYCAEILLRGDLEPGSVTEVLGLTPTAFWVKGEPHPRTKLPRSESAWLLKSSTDKHEPLEKHVIELLDRLQPVAEAVRQLAVMHESWLAAVAYFKFGQASCWLDADLVRRVADLRLGVWFDPYDLLSDDKGFE